MAEQTWTYSDWVTYETGNATRLSRLRLHIQEVSNKISTGNFSVENKAHDYSMLQQYLQRLLEQEKYEASAAGTNRATFVRGRPS